jgi:hypothetical protein
MDTLQLRRVSGVVHLPSERLTLASIGAQGSGPHEARRLSKPRGSFSRKAQWNALAHAQRFYRKAEGREGLLTAGLESWLNRLVKRTSASEIGAANGLSLVSDHSGVFMTLHRMAGNASFSL